MKDKAKFNVNYPVYVKLTPKGKDVYLRKMVEPDLWLKREPKYRTFEDTHLKPNKDGYYKFQLWELMEYFGSETHIGVDGCFETEIYFNKKDLTVQYKAIHKT